MKKYLIITNNENYYLNNVTLDEVFELIKM